MLHDAYAAGLRDESQSLLVMPALVAGINVLLFVLRDKKTWMAGTGPAMTKEVVAHAPPG
jgi:hypothetical protein